MSLKNQLPASLPRLCLSVLVLFVSLYPVPASQADAVVAPSASSLDSSGDPNPPRKNKYQKSKLTNDESEALADKRKLLLATGEDKAVDLDFDANAGANGISYGNPQVVTTTLVKIGEKRQLVFKPLKAGETTVSVRDNDGTLRLIFKVRVTGSDLLTLASEIRNLLRDLEGLDIRVVGAKVILEGELLVPADYGRVLAVVQDKSYADIVMNLTTLSPLGMQVIAKRIQNDILAFAPNVTVRVVNGMLFLEGTVDGKMQAERAESVASLYLPEMRPGSQLEKDPSVQKMNRKLVWNFIVINPPPPEKSEKMVRVTVYFVELAKDYNKVFGFKWMPGFTSDPQISIGQSASGAAGASSAATFSGTISSLLPKLQSLQTAGFARILKTATVIVRSGQPARMTEQTDYPFATPPAMTAAGAAGGGVSSSKVGISLSVTPMIVGQTDDIQIVVDLNQSQLVGRGASPGTPPVVANHTVKTDLYIRNNESAAIGGITADDIGTDFNKDDPNPGSFDAGTDPLFKLLHSKAFRKQRSQFVIFVTPIIIENASDGTEDLKKNFRVKAK